ncbi:hypothetical protein TWF694_008184 [Orbilia ellipsospora]|uniref:Zn(2)-C6 fungal-type domain-containing protein n=1 Tax=Orbilia ellipsospora TaxID=2528407 RepID=A0AAV9XI05_9PEZI
MSLQSQTEKANKGADGLKIWSCTNCRRRKVRCDRRHPCVPCTRHNFECIFPISGRLPRRTRNAGVSQPGPVAPKHEQLLSRLRSLEAIVSELGSQVENAVTGEGSNDQDSNENMSNTDDSVVSISGTGSSQTKSISPGAGRYDSMVVEKNGDLVVGDRFWTVFCGEVEHIFEAVRQPEPYDWESHIQPASSGPVPPERSHSAFFNFLFRQANGATQYDQLHPPPAQMLFLWQTFVDYIDPLFKLIHVPSMTRLIRDLRGHYHLVEPGTETLIYAICLAAASILTEEDISINFSTTKEQLTSRYRLGTEQALQKAQLPATRDLHTLQALAIYVHVLQTNGEQDLAWTLTGILIRTAIRLDLHKDGSQIPGLEPFEVEMRRRVWWQICLIDSCGGSRGVPELSISEKMFDTKLPSNIDDASFNPKISKLPVSEERRTDVTIFLIRCEIWRQLTLRLLPLLTTKNAPGSQLDEICSLFADTVTNLQKTYLDHLDPTVPLDGFASVMIKRFFSRVRLCILEFSRSQPSPGMTEEQIDDEILSYAVSIIEDTYTAETDTRYRPWSWAMRDKPPLYHVLGTIFQRLLVHKWDATFARAWEVAVKYMDTVKEANPQYEQLVQLRQLVQEHMMRQLEYSTSSASIGSQSSQMQINTNGSGTVLGEMNVLLPSNSNNAAPLQPFKQSITDVNTGSTPFESQRSSVGMSNADDFGADINVPFDLENWNEFVNGLDDWEFHVLSGI